MNETENWKDWKPGQLLQGKNNPNCVLRYAGQKACYSAVGAAVCGINPDEWEPVPGYNPPPCQVGDRVRHPAYVGTFEVTGCRSLEMATIRRGDEEEQECFAFELEPAPPEPKPQMGFAEACQWAFDNPGKSVRIVGSSLPDQRFKFSCGIFLDGNCIVLQVHPSRITAKWEICDE